jgi:hypothetical protein
MKKVSLMMAAIALVGMAACQKIETPEAQQEEPEVIQTQEPQQEIVQEPAATEPSIETAAAVLNEVAEKEEVKLFIKNLMFMIREGKDARHFEFGVSLVGDDQEYSYVSGSLGLVVGDLHPVAIDVDLLFANMISVVGQVDLVQISHKYARAALAIDNFTCEFYLKEASKGLDLIIWDKYKIAFFRGVDEETGKRTMDLYMYDPAHPEYAPIPLGGLFKSLVVG